MKKLITILTIITMTAGMLAGIYAHDQSLARATDILVIREQISAIHTKLEQDQNLRRARDIESRLWTLENRYEDKIMPISVKEEVQRLGVELRELREK